MSGEFWSIVQGICALIGAGAVILAASHFISSQPSTRIHRSQIRRNTVIVIVSTALILLLSAGIFVIPGYFQSHRQVNASPTGAPAKTVPATSITHQTTSTARPASQALYMVDFTQGSQGWLDNSPSSQWTYDDTSKVLVGDGSMPCCSSLSQLATIVLNAPATFTTGNYTIEARIKVMGTNASNPYQPSQPPFFGLFFRGYGLNGNGYMAGIIGFEPNDTSTGPLSYILVQEPENSLREMMKLTITLITNGIPTGFRRKGIHTRYL
jgi:hypothetical protein